MSIMSIMSFQAYKVLHFLFIFLALTSMSIGLVGQVKNKIVKRVGMTSSLFILITGIGLYFKIGYTQTMPKWIVLITFLWLIIAIGGPIAAKKVQRGRVVAYYFFMGIAGLAALVAVTKLKF